uniref:CXXC finger protein 5 n=1 Tax=Myotis myotis TaxID=51298 RepID=A0A7J7XER6_MYOMY|nr:CXXC finger protein 5 [Myotis myotis]
MSSLSSGSQDTSGSSNTTNGGSGSGPKAGVANKSAAAATAAPASVADDAPPPERRNKSGINCEQCSSCRNRKTGHQICKFRKCEELKKKPSAALEKVMLPTGAAFRWFQ